MALIPRPTRLPGHVIGWLETFGESFISVLPVEARPAYLSEVRSALEAKLGDTSGVWVAPLRAAPLLREQARRAVTRIGVSRPARAWP